MECTIEKVCEQKFENIETKYDNKIDGIEKNFDEKFKVANHRISDLEVKTEEINSISNVLVELQLLSKLQREDGVKRDKLFEELNKNQIEISNTLKTLTDSLNKTDASVDKLDKKVDENNKELNKKVDEIKQDNTIKVSDITKKVIFGVICTTFGVGATIIVTKIMNKLFS